MERPGRFCRAVLRCGQGTAGGLSDRMSVVSDTLEKRARADACFYWTEAW